MRIKTTGGYVEGFEENGLQNFLGIPYARAERFQAPREINWEGVFQADAFGKKAVQSHPAQETQAGWEGRKEYGEDCLNLNIYVPARAALKARREGRGLPVAVYIHGGAFQNGSNRDRSGKQIIRDHSFIYVSINYRLGVLGYLYLGAALGEEYRGTGNNGTLDQLAALRWIYDNIGEFGGDRSRITVFGESAGAKTLGALLLRPELKTCCSQVLMASGAYQCIREEETAAAVADSFFSLAGLKRPEDILTMDVDNLLAVQERLVDNPGNTCTFGPVADGITVPMDWREALRSGRHWSGKAIVGSCRHEMVFRRLGDPDFTAHCPAIARALFGQNAEIAIEEFEEFDAGERQEESGSALRRALKWEQLLSDYMYRTYSRRLAELLAKNGSQVWYYSMDFGTASHVLDQSAAFDGAWRDDALFPGIALEERRKTAEIIYESYVRFFETGDPNWEGIPEWKPLGDEREKMVWDGRIHTEPLTEEETLNRFPDEVFRLQRSPDHAVSTKETVDPQPQAVPDAAMEEASDIIARVTAQREAFWINPHRVSFAKAKESLDFTMADIEEAQARLLRFAPFLEGCFPELQKTGGIIESPLQDIPAMAESLWEGCGAGEGEPLRHGRMLMKLDSELAVAGSVKARGGIYEVLAATEELALKAGLLKETDDYSVLLKHRDFFSHYTMQVGSTGNLGLSIGIMSAAIGYRAVVHMSSDARQWKKDLLRSKGVIVKEYEGDYGAAVKEGRALSDADENSYFVDDEHSSRLFLGYAAAALRLKKQLADKLILVDGDHPLFVYLPCGVGGAPGGITLGLKYVFGDAVHCFFAEPVQSPCMLLGMATGKGDQVCVQDFGLSGKTLADGLAVGRPSELVARNMRPLLDGIYTVQDECLPGWMQRLNETEGVIIEPSACACLGGPKILAGEQGRAWLKQQGLYEKTAQATHIVWATGGGLMPEEIITEYLNLSK